jgi:hypothetical protein
VFGVFAYALLTVAWAPLRRGVGWLLLPLGRDALTSYSLHVFIVPLVAVLLPIVRAKDPGTATENALLQLVAVLAVWSVVVTRTRAAPFLQLLVARPRLASSSGDRLIAAALQRGPLIPSRLTPAGSCFSATQACTGRHSASLPEW